MPDPESSSANRTAPSATPSVSRPSPARSSNHRERIRALRVGHIYRVRRSGLLQRCRVQKLGELGERPWTSGWSGAPELPHWLSHSHAVWWRTVVAGTEVRSRSGRPGHSPRKCFPDGLLGDPAVRPCPSRSRHEGARVFNLVSGSALVVLWIAGIDTWRGVAGASCLLGTWSMIGLAVRAVLRREHDP